jgi:hypothetical protein
MRPLISGEAVLVVCITVMIIFFGGDPDIADAIIHNIGGVPACGN